MAAADDEIAGDLGSARAAGKSGDRDRRAIVDLVGQGARDAAVRTSVGGGPERERVRKRDAVEIVATENLQDRDGP